MTTRAISTKVIMITIWIMTTWTAADKIDRFFIDRPGDFVLGGLFPLHRRGTNENDCGPFQTMPGYHYLEAMLFAIDKINNDTSILPNIALGARIYDSCRSQTVGAKMTKELITMAVFPPVSGEQLAGVIGAHSSDLSKVVADFLRVFEIPQVSYGSTATLLSDKSIYSYFFRTVPPDNLQARAIAEVVVKLGWNFVITINSAGTYGTSGIEQFHAAATEHEICIALRLSLSSFPTKAEFNRLVYNLNQERSAKGVVLFTNQRDSWSILEAFARNRAKPFFWVASDSWGINDDVANGGLEHLAEGAITLTQFSKPMQEFDEYFRSLNANDERLLNNAWSQQFWQNHFNCSLNGSVSDFVKNCSGNESIASATFHFAPVQTVVNAVYAMAHALHDYMSDRCTRGDCGAFPAIRRRPIDRSKLVGYLKNTTFTDQATGKQVSFNEHQEISGGYSIFNFQKTDGGGYDYKEVGVWKSEGKLELDVTKLRWPNHTVNMPAMSRCSKPCDPGKVRRRKDEHDIVCCWDCVKCPSSDDIIVNDTCARCPAGHSPDTRLVKCVKYPAVDILARSSSKAILAISLLGLVCVAVVAVVFIKYSHLPLIKASSRELSGIILFGLSLLFTFPWLLLSEPSRAICVAQIVLLGVALASCYAPLFMKILRIYRIFASAKRSVNKPFLVSPASQVLITTSLILIQCLFGAISFFSDVPAPLERVVSDIGARKILVECSLEKKMFVSLLSYNMLLMALCTVIAFKTRRFPRNFNEAKYIGFTMYFTCFVWIIFFPFYLNSGDGLARIKWEASAVLAIGWITLIGLFGPKICFLLLGHVGSESDDRLTMTGNTSTTDASVLRVDTNAVTPSKVRRNKEEDNNENENKNEKLRSLSDA